MKKVNQKILTDLLNNRPEIPDGKSGDASVTHRIIPPGHEEPVVSLRNAMFMGWQPTKISFSSPFTIRQLSQKSHGVWMTDSPQEVWQMWEPIKAMKGRVLVGGLGLGVFPSLLLHSGKGIACIDVVEISKPIVKLVSPYIHDIIEVHRADLYDELNSGVMYDSAFFDIWQPTGEMVWAEHVVPLRRLCRNRIKTVRCWNEEEMIGQLRQGLPHFAVVSPEASGAMAYMETFRKVCQTSGVKPMIGVRGDFKDTRKLMEAYQSSENNPQIRQMLDIYLKPGTDEWESLFGDTWDAHHTVLT